MFKQTRRGTWYLAVILALILAGVGRADFILWNDEWLVVHTSHSNGHLYDQSHASVASSGIVGNIWANHSSTVGVSSDGRVGGLYAYDTSTVDMEDDGSSVSQLYAYESSTVRVDGGSVGGLYAHNSSTVDISGGTVTDRLRAYDDSAVTFHALDFRLGGGLSLDGDRVVGTGILSGEWYDSTRWTIDIDTNASGATIRAAVLAPDANGDGVVDDLDLTALAAHWQQPGGRNEGDFNGDGFVDDLDLTILATAWPGGGLEISAVPEPTTLSLLALSGLALLGRKER